MDQIVLPEIDRERGQLTVIMVHKENTELWIPEAEMWGNMKVRKIMTEKIGVCGPNDPVPAAIGIMWEKDCGIVPIVAKEKVVGVVTDRDIAIFMASQNRMPGQVILGEMLNGKVVTCRENESVNKVLKKMSKYSLRRLPVVGKKGDLKGMISIADILKASTRKKDLKKKVVRTLSELSKPRKIVFSEQAK